MRLDPSVRVGGLLAALVVSGFLALHAAPDGGTVIGIWPVGVASALALEVGRRRAPYVLPVVLFVAVLTIWLGGRPADVAIGYGLGITVETALVVAVLTRGVEGRPPLRTDADLRRYYLAVAGAGLVAAASGGLTSVLTGFGNPGTVALALGTAHLASQITLLPFFMRLPPHGSIASVTERVLQWAAIIVITPLVFSFDDVPSMAFMVVPLLAWGAQRIRPFEALAQMAALVFFAILMTTAGRGPFAAAPQAYDLPADARGVFLAAFATTCALIVVPLLIRVGAHIVISREARSERDKVQSIVDGATGIAIIGADAEGRVTLFNPGAERLLGYSAAEMMGRSTRILHSMRSVVDKARELRTAPDFGSVVQRIVTGEHAGTLMRFRRKDGVERIHSMTLTRMVDERGATVGYVSTSEDVTDSVDAQQRLQDALDTERQAVDRLREVDRAKDAFVSSVSHELRTPITSIMGYLELLGDGSYGPLTPDQGKALKRVSDNSGRLLGLIDELLTLSRLSEDGLALSTRAFDLREVVREGYAVVAPAWAHRRLEVSLDLPEEPVEFVGDRDMLERVVVNLVGNAVKFTPEGGAVSVVLGGHGSEVHLDVRDTGVGIPHQEIEQLFSRFFRSSIALEKAIPGSGLGLSITRAIVEKHGGAIDVESAVGRGTLFRVRMPTAA
ncbi:ATP-binding protein [Nocardioides sp. NPDC092400]|uniref:ATP-binding protein n=1 Tax=Nocardioides sp. NPDC092400 TaxID=3155196 RepID=UPI003437912D